MVCAGICHDGCTQLKIVQGTLNAVKYICNILDPIVLSFLLQRNFDHVFQHDNARCHVACVCQEFLNQNQIRVSSWAALSPDLSPIKHLCGELGGRRARQSKSTGNTTGAAWRTCARVEPLIGSMRQRCEAVVAARSGHTRYWTLQTSILHDNFCLSMICSDNDIEKCCWYYLICYAHMNLNYTIFFQFDFSM